MQFSKKVSDLARAYNIDHKDVLFALLISAGASTAESYAVIYRPTSVTTSALANKASQYIGQRPGLRKLIDELNRQQTPDGTPTPKRGRPRKDPATADAAGQDAPRLDYTDKDAVLQELARIAERCEKESDRLAAIREISALQRMKNEAAVEDEKRVIFYIPLSFEYCEQLFAYLDKYYSEQEQKHV